MLDAALSGKIRDILVITLSNIGDVILTTPVIDLLRKSFPKARLSVVVGPRAAELFAADPRIYELIVYDKHVPFLEKLKIISRLRKKGYDLVVDLRNTLIPYLLGARFRSSPLKKAPGSVSHKRDIHLWKLKPFKLDTSCARPTVWYTEQDKDWVEGLLKDSDNFVAVSPGARSDTKRWAGRGFMELCNRLIDEWGVRIVIVGDKDDEEIALEIAPSLKASPVMACGKTTLPQLAALLRRCRLLISNDSAAMHMGWAVGTPTVAVFGPTDPAKYGPTKEADSVVKADLHCSPCEKAQCATGGHECMSGVTVDMVFEAAKQILSKEQRG